MTPPNDPAVYLSTSDGAWRVIHRGSPLCADHPDRLQAIKCALAFGYSEASLPIWDGDAGAWRAVCPRCLTDGSDACYGTGLRPGIPAGIPTEPHPGPFTPDGCATCNDATRPIAYLGDAWPWPRVANARRAGAPTWFQTTEERADDARDALPPIFIAGGGFFMGEPAAHDDRGVPVYAAFIKIAGRYFVREVARDQIQPAIAVLRAALDGAS